MLNILKASELKELQKTYKINSHQTKTKPEMIRSFTKLVKNQKTFCGNSVCNLKKGFVYISFILGGFNCKHNNNIYMYYKL